MNFSQSTAGYNKLWGLYQEKMLRKLKETKTDPHPQAVLWTSTLTEPDLIDEYLTPEDYIIQIWTSKTDNSIKSLIEKKFRVIFSNYDELYLDCGFADFTWLSRDTFRDIFFPFFSSFQRSLLGRSARSKLVFSLHRMATSLSALPL